MTEPLQLFLRAKRLEFGVSEFAEFRRKLETIDARTLVCPPASRRDLLLNMDATTQNGGYRYTDVAFQQVCGVAAKGLGRLVQELAGAYRTADQPWDMFDTKAAIRIFNDVIALRFDQEFLRRKLVFNRHHKLIEGVLGPKTHFLDNIQLLGLVQDTLTSQRDVEFRSACIAGRQLLLRYTDRQPLWENSSKSVADCYHYGYHFSNTEAGDASLRGGNVIYRLNSDTAALRLVSPRKSNRVFHTGRSFMLRLHELVDMVAGNHKFFASCHESDTGVRRLKTLAKRKLVVADAAMPTTKAVVEAIEQQLYDHGIARQLASRVARQVVYVGGEPGTGELLDVHVSRDKLLSRSLLDLYNAIGLAAMELHITAREQLEQLAFDLFTQKWKVVPYGQS